MVFDQGLLFKLLEEIWGTDISRVVKEQQYLMVLKSILRRKRMMAFVLLFVQALPIVVLRHNLFLLNMENTLQRVSPLRFR